ncbi:MAG: hypothetical protein PHS41_04420 [Victivallaceae bacterium]|nr:hypothetical protein [Victivallaceae bacterium]
MRDPLLKEEYLTKDMPEGYFTLLPDGVARCVRFPSESKHNACWDYLLCKDGTAYVSLCGELSQPLCVQLWRFDTKTGKFTMLFDTGREFYVSPREIPPSKIHTSLTEMPDGRILMTTHTTARAPGHPYWLFDSYFEHIHEGYPGSHVLIYDPVAKSVKNLGIPVKHDSIYGGCLDAKHNAFFFTTFLKGKLFRLNLDDLTLLDMGQITEMGSYCVVSDGEGHIYTSSRTGHIFRIDCDSLEISDLGIAGAQEEELYRWKLHRVMAHWTKGPDGNCYFTMHFSDKLYKLEPKTGAISVATTLAPGGKWRDAPPGMLSGHVFDSHGRLWFVMTRESVNDYPGGALHLFSCDLFGTGEIRFHGLVGAGEHASAIVCHMAIDENDVLQFPDGNHGEDMASFVSVDLGKLAAATGNAPRHASRDVWTYCSFADGADAYPKNDFEAASEKHWQFRRYMIEDAAWRGHFADTHVRPDHMEIARLWEQLPFADDHTITEVRFAADDDTVEAVAGGRLFVWRAGKVSLTDAVPTASKTTPLPKLPTELAFPARSGRRHLAKITASATLSDGRMLLGSADGVFALFAPAAKTLYALGAVGAEGAVHQLAASGDGSVIYGIMGDPDDLGHLVRFDLRRGLIDLGRMVRSEPDSVLASNTELASIAVNGDGTRVAVGAAGRLACLYLCCFPAAKESSR